MESDIKPWTRILRDRPRTVVSRVKTGLARLVGPLRLLKHAYETTATDRDRLASEVAELREFKHAFETTARDRDQLVQQIERYKLTVDKALLEKDRLSLEIESLRQQGRDATDYKAETAPTRAGELETYRRELEEIRDERDQLIADVKNYKHAFETTAQDRDNIATKLREAEDKLKNHQEALEKTRQDRERISQANKDWRDSVGTIVAQGGLGPLPKPNAPLPEPRRAIEGPGLAASKGETANPARLPVPNVFCVGVQKTGTSFLYSVLREHPLVHVGPKDRGELQRLYMSEDNSNLPQFLQSNAAGYKDEPAVGSFEVGYFEIESGAEFIRDVLAPDGRIMICLRDPVRRAVSEYQMRLRHFNPTSGKFQEALGFQEAIRQEPQRKRQNLRKYMGQQAYTGRGRYHAGVKRYFDVFGKDNVFVTVLEEDLKEKLSGTLINLFAFLSIQDADALRIALSPPRRYAASSRSPKEIEARIHLADGSVADASADVAVDEILARGVLRLEIKSDVPTQLSLDLENPTEEQVRTALTLPERHALKLDLDEEREIFETHFREDVGKLEKLLERDLSVWYARYGADEG